MSLLESLKQEECKGKVAYGMETKEFYNEIEFIEKTLYNIENGCDTEDLARDLEELRSTFTSNDIGHIAKYAKVPEGDIYDCVRGEWDDYIYFDLPVYDVLYRAEYLVDLIENMCIQNIGYNYDLYKDSVKELKNLFTRGY